MWHRRHFLSGAAAGAICALPLGRALAQDAWAKVEENAKKEGALQVYSVIATSPVVAMVKAFEKKTGIRTEFLSVAKQNELREKVRVEQSASRFVADIMLTTVAQTTVISAEDKTIAPLPQVPAAARLRPDLKTSQPILPIAVTMNGILANTSLVKPEDMPRRWADLVDPKWKGKILMDDPRAIGGGYLMFYAMYEKLGKEFVEKLAAQDVLLTNEPREAIRRVARGEKALLLPVSLVDALDVKGLPVKAIVPEEGVVYNQFGATMLKGAPHPNAAALFIDFALSDEAQTLFANAGVGIATGDASKIARPEVQEFVNAKLWGTIDPLKQNEMMGNARAAFK